MRKKSHISLARYLVKDIKTKELLKHKKAFYLGNILPDIKPSFITTKHEFNGTIEMLQNRIAELVEGSKKKHKNDRVFARRLGEVIHYIADYFTFPHNHTYDGNLRDHVHYEKELKFSLKEYLKSGPVLLNKELNSKLKSKEDLFNYIFKSHKEYLSLKRNVKEDCEYIVRICHKVVQYIFDSLTAERKYSPIM